MSRVRKRPRTARGRRGQGWTPASGAASSSERAAPRAASVLTAPSDAWNGGMPSQVDTSAFRVGGNIATTEGSVVHRDPILELIQYRPLRARVSARAI